MALAKEGGKEPLLRDQSSKSRPQAAVTTAHVAPPRRQDRQQPQQNQQQRQDDEDGPQGEGGGRDGHTTTNNTNANNWEEHLETWLRRFHQWRQQNDDDDNGDRNDDGDGGDDRSTASSHWLRRYLRRRLRQASATEKALWVGCALTVLGLVGYRRRRRRRELGRGDSTFFRPFASLLFLATAQRDQTYRSAAEAPLSLLYNAARDGQLERALLGSTGVYYTVNGDWKRSNVPSGLSSKDLMDALSKSPSRTVDISALPEPILSRLATPLLACSPFIYLFFLYRIINNTMGGDIAQVLRSRSTTTFDDVAGLDDVIGEVSEIVTYLKHPSRYVNVGARPPRAVLLYGPPGTGKTLLAQATAGQADVDCFLACSASDFVEIYVGRGAARVRSLFAQARNQAKRASRWRRQGWWWKNRATTAPKKPSAILFIDELDALGKTRGGTLSSNDEREQTLNQLLTELDGFDKQDDVTLIVMAASNRVDVLDPALLRRFDRQIPIGYPDASGRRDILKIHGRNITCDLIDWHRLASEARTGGFSGADLRNLVNDAALLAVRDGAPIVRQSHLEHAARRLQQMKWKGDGSVFAEPRGSIQLGIR